MSLVDYHVHTYLCEHASGVPGDYIRNALDAGLSEIGFSDHAPLPLGLREGITMSPEQTELYIDLIEEQRGICKDKIIVKIGFEVDYPLVETFDRKYLTDVRLDYLIGSCHYLGDWAFDHPDNISEFDIRDIDEVYHRYYKIIEDLASTRYFNIIGHFDLVKKFGHRSQRDFTDFLERLCKIISENDMAVEINTAGLRKPVEEIYPSRDIIDIMFQMNVPVTLGSDSHKPEEVGYHFSRAIEELKNAGYKMISGFSKRKRYDIAI